MELCLLLFIPVLIGLFGFIFGKNFITWKEFLVQEAAVVVFIVIGFFIGRCSQTLDEEVWSGRVIDKKQIKVSCSHSYPCNPHPCNCDNKGSCDTCWDTCYEHIYDYDWNVYSSTGDVFTIARIDRQGVSEPPRFTQAYIGEPVAASHYYTNYIKASPWTIIKRTGAKDKFLKLIPPYPNKVYDYYRVDRFVVVGFGLKIKDAGWWNRQLAELNADLGKKKQVNVVIVAVNTADSSYVHALEEAWLGGKKNDFVIILGVPNYPKIDWVRTMSWTRVEDIKISIRDSIQAIGTMEKREEIISLIYADISKKFVRRPMSDFKYLNAEIRPPTWALFLILILGIALSIGLTIFFYFNDPFGDGRIPIRRRRR